MFERRLKTLGILLTLAVVVLIGRLFQLQVFGRSHYRQLAQKVLTQQRLIETTRGSIVDIAGRVIAEDSACIDAAVDYRAITQDVNNPIVRDWVRRLAVERLRNRPDSGWRSATPAGRKKLLEDEQLRVRADIDAMWPRLAALAGMSLEQMQDIRASIDLKVKIRQRRNTWKKYEAAVAEATNRPRPPWYQRWLVSGDSDEPTEDEFEEVIQEQTDPHVILRNISQAVQNELGKNAAEYPGLSLIPSTHRTYPYHNQAAHAIGYLRKVRREDLARDPQTTDELREYQLNDDIGDIGIEALAERRLRGTRGSEAFIGGPDASSQRVDPIPGRPVITTLDIELQSQIREAFTRVRIPHPDRDRAAAGEHIVQPMHGAAVVIDVATGEVRALVSFPDFDLNGASDNYATLSANWRDNPLFNRATLSQYEPGSTVKPAVGLAAIGAGLATIDTRIECTGFLTLRGRTWQTGGRCWTATLGPTVYPHHSIPSRAPHHGPTPDLDGFLNFQEAIQRSCNIYFENMADRLGAEQLSIWFEKFGIGRPTGIGIAEATGTLPRRFPRGPAFSFATWTSGIGQTGVLATPIQICSAMSTIARGGIWIRPRLVRDADELTPATASDWPDRYDLQLPPEAVAAARRGMALVVNSDAGTGQLVRRDDVTVAAKTGTAQAAPFKLPMLDDKGRVVKNEKGHTVWVRQRPSTWNNPNPDLPWYRASDESGRELHHAWLAGFAPAENPTIAFVVMIEYGGAGGGAVAGPVARELLEACVEHGYIARRR